MTDAKARKGTPPPAAASAPASDAIASAADTLTVRDQIAMRAPTAPAWWTNAYMARTGSHSIDAQALATWAYEYADAAMVERAK